MVHVEPQPSYEVARAARSARRRNTVARLWASACNTATDCTISNPRTSMIVAVARKLAVLANTLIKQDRLWKPIHA